jgi:flavin reductase (DIM6/NTAB) family NADH-FMN oxidoreductase RutF
MGHHDDVEDPSEEAAEVKQETGHAYVFPDPVALIAVADESGGSNIITLAWVGMACSDPVHISIGVRPQRYSNGLLRAAGEFTLNLPSAEMVEAVDYCGSVSGRDHDKWAEAPFTREPARQVGAPLIAECRYALECRIVETVSLGAHDLFIARVLLAHVDDTVLAEDGSVDTAALDPLAYAPHAYFKMGEKVYTYGQSLRDRRER